MLGAPLAGSNTKEPKVGGHRPHNLEIYQGSDWNSNPSTPSLREGRCVLRKPVLNIALLLFNKNAQGPVETGLLPSSS